MNMDKLRIGIVGIGGMGSNHARQLLEGKVKGATLTAVCDIDPARLTAARENLSSELDCYLGIDEFLKADPVDAVIIATTHYHHSPIAVKCFERGLHVLTEKPAGVYTKQVREMNEAAEASGKIFAIMFNQRTDPKYRKLREMVCSGELGELKRTNWIVTSWYRTQAYYDAGGWRATWAGEGGGILTNQDPHQLDLWQWCCGMPLRVTSFCYVGKYHDIEVEDDVTAFVEYPNGATGVFVTSTADAPGTNRLEVTGDCGKVVVEGNKVKFWKLDTPERKFNRENTESGGHPKTELIEFEFEDGGSQHLGILRNFAEAIIDGAELIAPGAEGILALSITNAMYLSSWTDDWITLPPDEELYWKELSKRIETSDYKENGSDRIIDPRTTF